MTIGTVYAAIDNADRAKYWYNHLSQSRSAAHRAYAEFALARLAVAHPSSSKIESPFLFSFSRFKASLSDYPNGSWHDETLRELALLLEHDADEIRHREAEKAAKEAAKEAKRLADARAKAFQRAARSTPPAGGQSLSNYSR